MAMRLDEKVEIEPLVGCNAGIYMLLKLQKIMPRRVVESIYFIVDSFFAQGGDYLRFEVLYMRWSPSKEKS